MDDDSLRKTDVERKRRIKYYADKKNNVKYSDIAIGDTLLLKIKRNRKSDPYYDPSPYTIIQRKRNMLIAERGHQTVTRNTLYFKKIPNTTELNDDMNLEINNTQDHSNEENTSNQRTLRRSTQDTGQPVRHPMDVTQ